MGKNKLKKFADLATYPNVYQNMGPFPAKELVNHKGEKVQLADKWNELAFGNEHPIVLELACGNGEYTIGMAGQKPDSNFIGIDIKGNRIWNGASYALEHNMSNVAFVRSRIEELENLFAPKEINEIWITFPDPFLSDRRMKRRLTYSRFLQMYKNILKEGGIVHLKTDSTPLYEFTLEMIAENKAELLYHNADIYGTGYEEPLLSIQTKYEKMHLSNGLKIKYVKFRF